MLYRVFILAIEHYGWGLMSKDILDGSGNKFNELSNKRAKVLSGDIDGVVVSTEIT